MPKYSWRLLVAGLAAAVVLAASGCGQRPQPDDDRPLVLTTFTVLADMAQVVAGDLLRVESITKFGAEIHGYEPTPGDIRHAADAALILDNGLGLEAWFEQFIAQADAPRVTVSASIDPIPIAGSDAPNPHAWMSAQGALSYVDAIERAFAELAPEHTAAFAANAEAYKSEIAGVHEELLTALAAIPPQHRALVTCEGAFSYLARDAGLTEQYLWPVNAEQQATPQQIAAAIAFVDERSVPAVFCESTVSDRAMQQVVQATDARFGGILYVDSLSEPDGPVPTYLDLLRHAAATIAAGLAGA